MNTVVKHAVISAAGLGSRLGLNIPKCLVKLGNRELIYYLLPLLEHVENVRVIVGFKEMEIIEVVRQIRRDAIFVRNPNFATTSNAYSLYLGTRHLKEPYLTIDGDMFIDPVSFGQFLSRCVPGTNLIGITQAKSEDAVFVELNDNQEIMRFQRSKPTPYEWCGIAYFDNISVRPQTKYVFNEIETSLPAKSCVIDCYEVDTPQDLDILQANSQSLLAKYGYPCR